MKASIWKRLHFRRYASTDQTRQSKPSFTQQQIAKLRAKYPNSAPASLIGAFLVLHEVTAILPVIGFFYLFEYGHLALGQRLVGAVERSAPDSTLHAWLQACDQKVERVGKRYGYFGYEKENTVDAHVAAHEVVKTSTSTITNAVAAYLVVKLLLPVRLAACFYLSPPLANAVGGTLGRLFWRTGQRYQSKRVP